MHKLRIVNPSSDSGDTMGTEVWLDDRKLDGVTYLSFEAKIKSMYHVQIGINVFLDEIALHADPEFLVNDPRLAHAEELIADAQKALAAWANAALEGTAAFRVKDEGVK